MRDREGRTPRRVAVTRIGADAFLVVVGSTTVALSWLELSWLAGEAGEALGLRPPILNQSAQDPDGGGCRDDREP